MNIMPAERLHLIRDRLARNGRVVAAELADELHISEDSIRRDLRDLAAQGVCQRVYGGAILTSSASSSARQRKEQSRDRKRQLGEALARVVKEGQLIFVDAGTTNLATARALPTGRGLTVVTHDPAVAAALVGREGIELHLIGGRVDPHTGAAMGGATLRAVAAMRPELVLLGVCALDTHLGIGAFNAEDADLKRTLLENAGSVAIAVLNEKLGAAARFAVGPVSMIDDVVVEADAPESAVTALSELSIRIHRALPANKE
jgi:DeoR/GlpR family transcriptional regulator of sugar metabolism